MAHSSALLVALLALTPALLAQPPTAPVNCPRYSSHIALSSGTFSSQPGVTFRLKNFTATLIPMGKTAPACFQKMTVVSHAEIFVSNESLTQVFAEKIGASDSKIKELKIENGASEVTLSGKITKIIPVQFTIEGPVTTDGTVLLVAAARIKADGIPVKALLGLVGEHLSNVIGMKGVSGVSIDGNSLSFAPEQVAHLRGHISSVETTPEGLILRYGPTPARRSGPATVAPPSKPPTAPTL